MHTHIQIYRGNVVCVLMKSQRAVICHQPTWRPSSEDRPITYTLIIMTKGPGMSVCVCLRVCVCVCVCVWRLLVFYGVEAGGIMSQICQNPFNLHWILSNSVRNHRSVPFTTRAIVLTEVMHFYIRNMLATRAHKHFDFVSLPFFSEWKCFMSTPVAVIKYKPAFDANFKNIKDSRTRVIKWKYSLSGPLFVLSPYNSLTLFPARPCFLFTLQRKWTKKMKNRGVCVCVMMGKKDPLLVQSKVRLCT